MVGKCCVPATIWIQTEFKKSNYCSCKEYMSGKCLHAALENLSRKRNLLCPLCICYLSHQCLELAPSNIFARLLVCCFLNKNIALGPRHPFTILYQAPPIRALWIQGGSLHSKGNTPFPRNTLKILALYSKSALLPSLSSGELLSSLLGLQDIHPAVVSHYGKAKLLN